MRKVGERNMSSIPKAKQHVPRNLWRSNRQPVRVACKKCQRENLVSQAKLRRFYKEGYMCYSCYQNEKKEVKDAIKNLAVRKATEAQK